MKNFLLLFLFLFLILLAGFVLFSDSDIFIQWLDWNIHIDAFLFILLWLLSYVFISIILIIYRTPRKVKSFIQKRRTNKSTSRFNKALLSYLKDDFNEAIEGFSLIDENDVYFEAQLMSAVAMFKINDINKTAVIIRKLMRQYPNQASLLQCLLAKWQLQVGEYHLAYETLSSEIKQGSPVSEKWFIFMEATEHTGRLSEWKLLLPHAKKDLSRQDFKELCKNLNYLQIKHAETKSQLKHIWDNIENSVKQNPAIIKSYLDCCNELEIHVDNKMSKIKQILKHEWRSDWLWEMANYPQFKDFHSLLDWCKDTVKQNNHAEDCTYFLSLAVVACRAQLWAISEDFLIQANKTLDKTEMNQRTMTLIKGWIDTHLEEQEISSKWAQLMAQYGMRWAVNT